jgi:hypothetical protein
MMRRPVFDGSFFWFFAYFIYRFLFLLRFIWSLVKFYRFGAMYWIYLHGRGINRTSSNHIAPRVENLVQFQNWKGVQMELTERRRLWFYWYSDGHENAYKLWIRICVVLLLAWFIHRTLKLETVCSPNFRPNSTLLYSISTHLRQNFKFKFLECSIRAIFWVTNH